MGVGARVEGPVGSCVAGDRCGRWGWGGGGWGTGVEVMEKEPQAAGLGCQREGPQGVA